MTLVPVKTEIFKSDNPQFNWDAARRTYEVLMKLDEDEVRALTTMVAVDVMTDTIEQHMGVLQDHLDKVIAKRVDLAKRAVAQRYRRDGASPELVKMAGELEEISKATKNQYDYGFRFSEADVRRDAQGRFATHIVGTQRRRPVKGIKIPVFEDEKGKTVKLTAAQQARYQNEYQQLVSFLRGAQDSGIDLKDDTVRMRLQNKKTGEVYTANLETRGGRPEPKKGSWDPRTEHVMSVEARPTTLMAGGAAFNLIGALGAPAVGTSVGGGVHAIEADDGRNLKNFNRDWYGGYDELNDNSSLYGRLASGGKFVGQIAPTGSKAQMAASFSQFVGEHGPEAEKVFGPPTRRAMYRYRGIQRKVNEEEISEETNSEISAQAGYAARWNRYKDYLTTRLPKGSLNSLNLASGHTPPSEGIILDKNGKATVQALGYGDDHYLPFNLKQLKGLRGGEYIRTRSTGGPTSEDIYTGLMSGAKAVTVVSRSGTFRIEFEPDFKGTRRYNQKAARMVGRYQRLLDAVRSREVERIPFDATRRRAIENEIRENYGNLPEQDIRELIDNRINEVKNATTLPDDEQAEYEQWAKEFDEQNQDKRVSWRAQAKAANYNARLEAHQVNFKLNGTGYKAAMDALREQFKYYIKDTHYRPRNADDDFYELGTDSGFVRAGALRPVAARANFFGGTQKASNQAFQSAERTNYGHLNRKFARAAELPQPQPTAAAEEAEETKSERVQPTQAIQRAREAIAERRAGDAFVDELLEFRKELQQFVTQPDHSATWIHDDEAEVRRNMQKGENRQKVFDWLDLAEEGGKVFQEKLSERIPDLRSKMRRLKDAGGKYGGKQYTGDDRLLNPDTPYHFEGPVFQPGQRAEVYMTAIHELQRGDKPFTNPDRPLSALSETEIRQEIDTAIQHYAVVEEAIRNGGGDGQVMAQIVNEGGLNLNRYPQVSKSIEPGNPSTKPMDEYLDRLHKIRAIRAASDSPVVPPKEIKKQAGLATSFAEIPGLLEIMS